MNIRLKIDKSVHENAALYYEDAKEIRKKIKGLEKAIEETKTEIEQAKKEQQKKKEQVKIRKEKKWYEKFHWFFTSEGKLVIGGKDAQQNDQLFAKMEDNDLFFHADIQGGSAVFLKDGINAGEQELLEVAQYAACFSNAWKNANATVDVYAVKKEQLSKHAHGGFIPSGGFAISGERKWFRSTALILGCGQWVVSSEVPDKKQVTMLPECAKLKLEDKIVLLPSKTGKEKGELAKSLAKRFGAHPDELLQILPNGRSKVK